MSKIKELTKLNDQDLLVKYEAMRKLIIQKKFSIKKQLQLEEELCYIQREINTRNIQTNNS